MYLGDRMQPKTERPVAANRPAGTPATNGAGPAATSTDLAALAGEYYGEEVDATYRIAVEGGQLVAYAPRQERRVLVPSGPDTFRAGQITLHFERGATPSFTIAAGRVRNIRFVRR